MKIYTDKKATPFININPLLANQNFSHIFIVYLTVYLKIGLLLLAKVWGLLILVAIY